MRRPWCSVMRVTLSCNISFFLVGLQHLWRAFCLLLTTISYSSFEGFESSSSLWMYLQVQYPRVTITSRTMQMVWEIVVAWMVFSFTKPGITFRGWSSSAVSSATQVSRGTRGACVDYWPKNRIGSFIGYNIHNAEFVFLELSWFYIYFMSEAHLMSGAFW